MLLFAAMDAPGLTPAAGPAGEARGDAVAAMARIRGGVGGEAALWWWSGRVYARRPGEIARLLLGVTGIGWSRIAGQADGSWQFAMSECGFFADAASGEFVESWVNPYTGKRLAPPASRLKLGYRIRPDGVIEPPFPGMSFDGCIGPLTQLGDTVWVGERLMANIPPPKPGAPRMGPAGNAVEFSSFSARRADVWNRALVFCPAAMQHQAAWPLYDWLEMAGEAGDILTHIVGSKVASAAELPAPLAARIERQFPGLTTSPGF